MTPTREQKFWMYRNMVTSRILEDSIEPVYLEGKTPVFNMADGPIPGEMHLSQGQEPCAVGVCAHLKPEDVVCATHRHHHIAIAKGVNLNAMMAEIFGKKTGLAGGRGGHIHIFDADVNYGSSGIIGQGMGQAAGAALSRKLQGKEGIAIAYLGEGAVNQGAFHEALNLAAVWNLPMVTIIEDNQWGVSVHKSDSTAVEDNSKRAAAYNMPGHYIPNNDPYEIFRVAGEAIERARNGGGPSLIEIETYRLAGHFMGDGEAYRPDGEKDSLKAKDPIEVMRARLEAEEGLTDDQNNELVGECRAVVEAAIQYARDSEYPAPEEAMEKVFI